MALNPALARQVYERDGWKCAHCNERGSLHPHHLIYRSQGGPDELWNLITLCAQCHRAHHDGFLKIEYYLIKADPIELGVGFERLRNWKPQ